MIKYSGNFGVIPVGGRHYQLFLFTGTTNNPRGFQNAGPHATGLDSRSAEQPVSSLWSMVGAGGVEYGRDGTAVSGGKHFNNALLLAEGRGTTRR